MAQPSTSFTSSGSEGGPESAEKKRHFEEMRKQHYDMKQALQQVCHSSGLYAM